MIEKKDEQGVRAAAGRRHGNLGSQVPGARSDLSAGRIVQADLRFEVAAVCLLLSSRSRHTTSNRDWSSDVCSSDLNRAVLGRTVDQIAALVAARHHERARRL